MLRTARHWGPRAARLCSRGNICSELLPLGVELIETSPALRLGFSLFDVSWTRQLTSATSHATSGSFHHSPIAQYSDQPKPEAEPKNESPSEEGPPGAAASEGEASQQEPGGPAEEDPKDKEIAELRERVLRAYADMENLMGRMKRENESARQFAIQGFAKALLDVADNLQRASEVAAAAFQEPAEGADPPSPESFQQHLKSLLEGVLATERQLLKAFKAHGLEKLDPKEEPFNPNLHEAMFEVPDPSKEPGMVVQVLKTGYTLNGRVLRAAEVGVTRKVDG